MTIIVKNKTAYFDEQILPYFIRIGKYYVAFVFSCTLDISEATQQMLKDWWIDGFPGMIL